MFYICSNSAMHRIERNDLAVEIAVAIKTALVLASGGGDEHASKDKLTADVRKNCEAALSQAATAKIVLGRPEVGRIDVDELTWAAMSATIKKQSMATVLCADFGVKAGGGHPYIRVFGYHSGKELAHMNTQGEVTFN